MSRFFNSKRLILNWTVLEKCLLMLTLAILLQISWLMWKFFIILQPGLWQFTSISLIKHAVAFNFAVIGLFVVLMLICHWFRKSEKSKAVLPYICIFFYGICLCQDAYLSGIMSPATSMVMVISVITGLLLFERKVIYINLGICLLALSGMLYETFMGRLTYAPIFITTAKADILASTIFWTASMLWFMVPIMIMGLVLIEILLSQWRKREEAVRLLSETDPLTGLYNRRTIHQFTNKLLNKKTYPDAINAVIMLDLDFFKRINDTYGHSIGDKVLSVAATVLNSCVRHEDKVGRFGGEEFIIVVCNSTHEQVHMIAERCRCELMQTDLSAYHISDLVITASFGITLFQTGHADATLDSLLKEADSALYQAKTQGRNQIVFYQFPQFIDSSLT